MNNLAKGILVVGLLAVAALVAPTASAGTPMAFGMDANSVSAQASAGVKPDYATFWVGPWTLKSGWGGPDSQLSSLKAAGVTPAVHFYYWGDDISPSCVENGCWSDLHNAQKTRAGWNQLGTQLTDHLWSKMGGAPALVFLETEFNKGGISKYEPFDGYMAEMAKGINARYPAAVVVLSFGNWDSANWGTFDRAAAASEMVGIQAMRGSTKDSLSAYNGAYDATLLGAQKMQGLFHKPIVLTDLALSSYPDSTYGKIQADNLQKFFTGLPALKAAGVKAILYRTWQDNPNMDLKNYYGEAERHWGFATATGQKLAAGVWIKGVKAERAGTTSTTTTTTTTTTQPTSGAFDATFTPKSQTNIWWIDVAVKGTSTIAKVEAKVNNGAWTQLPATSWGTYAKSLSAPNGAQVQFRATSTAGAVDTSSAYTWGQATSTPTTFDATFTPKSQTNNWWIDVAAKGNAAIAKVEAKVNNGAWTQLPATDWGTYAKSMGAPDGAKVQFRATSTTGATDYSATYTWG